MDGKPVVRLRLTSRAWWRLALLPVLGLVGLPLIIGIGIFVIDGMFVEGMIVGLVGAGNQIATVKDADGNVTGLFQAA